MARHEKLIAGVLGIVFNTEGQVLLTKRYEPEVPHEHSKWQLPGGALEHGEHPEDTLKREIKEELGLGGEIISPGPIIRSVVSESEKQLTHLIMFAYIIRLLDMATIDISNDPQATEFDWFNIDSLGEMETLPLVPGIVKEAKNRLSLIEKQNV